jgi:signal transduction histidine kinase
MSLWSAPEFDDVMKARRAKLLMTVLRTMVITGGLGAVVSFFDPGNSRLVWLGFYASTFAATAGLAKLLHTGRIDLAAWAISGWFWGLIAFVTLFFGGMRGQNAGVFVVSVMLVGAVVGGRSAFRLAVVSSAWCLGVVWLEATDRLPPQLGPYTPFNAWTAVTATLVLCSILLKHSIDSLEAMHRKAELAAQERDEALRRSIQSQKLELVGRLTSGIAHDLNNLLAVITSSAAYLRAQPLGGPDVQEAITDLDAATEGAALVTRQLLAFGRTRQGAPEPVSLREAMDHFLPIARRLAGPNVSVTVEIDGEGLVIAERSAIEQVLLNLTTNAVDAMPAGGTLSYRVMSEAEAVTLSVTDTGVGMDEATRTRIFEPFFTTRDKGTGLGLATVQRVAESLQARLDVRSSPGQGATFSMTFAGASAPVMPVGLVAPPTGAPRVLLVDDDPLVRRATSRVLESLDYEVVSVDGAAAALAVLDAGERIDVVVSDINMPGMAGDELSRVLATSRPSLPVVLTSGDRGPAEGLGVGPRRTFVPKPSSREALMLAIARVSQPPPAR